jgi:hypothetical protein
MKMSHMMADTLDELHEMADKIGVNRKWFQDRKDKHYDVCQSKKQRALELGAVLVSDRELISKFRLKK